MVSYIYVLKVLVIEKVIGGTEVSYQYAFVTQRHRFQTDFVPPQNSIHSKAHRNNSPGKPGIKIYLISRRTRNELELVPYLLSLFNIAV